MFLRISSAIDALTQRVGRIASWLVLISCLVSAGNAASRYALNITSNAFLELQWYMLAGIVMFGAAHTLRRNEHVRVDLIYGRLSPRGCAWLDIAGGVLFLMPAVVGGMWMSWPVFTESFSTHEVSSNAGGLLRWPVKLMLPVGFGLVALQGISEIIKRIAFLKGNAVLDTHYERPVQ